MCLRLLKLVTFLLLFNQFLCNKTPDHNPNYLLRNNNIKRTTTADTHKTYDTGDASDGVNNNNGRGDDIIIDNIQSTASTTLNNVVTSLNTTWKINDGATNDESNIIHNDEHHEHHHHHDQDRQEMTPRIKRMLDTLQHNDPTLSVYPITYGIDSIAANKVKRCRNRIFELQHHPQTQHLDQKLQAMHHQYQSSNSILDPTQMNKQWNQNFVFRNPRHQFVNCNCNCTASNRNTGFRSKYCKKCNRLGIQRNIQSQSKIKSNLYVRNEVQPTTTQNQKEVFLTTENTNNLNNELQPVPFTTISSINHFENDNQNFDFSTTQVNPTTLTNFHPSELKRQAPFKRFLTKENSFNTEFSQITDTTTWNPSFVSQFPPKNRIQNSPKPVYILQQPALNPDQIDILTTNFMPTENLESLTYFNQRKPSIPTELPIENSSKSKENSDEDDETSLILHRDVASYEAKEEPFNISNPKPLSNYLHFFNGQVTESSESSTPESDEIISLFPSSTTQKTPKEDELMPLLTVKQKPKLEKIIVLDQLKPLKRKNNNGNVILIDKANAVLEQPQEEPLDLDLIIEKNGFNFDDSDESVAESQDNFVTAFPPESNNFGLTENYALNPSDLKSTEIRKGVKGNKKSPTQISRPEILRDGPTTEKSTVEDFIRFVNSKTINHFSTPTFNSDTIKNLWNSLAQRKEHETYLQNLRQKQARFYNKSVENSKFGHPLGQSRSDITTTSIYSTPVEEIHLELESPQPQFGRPIKITETSTYSGQNHYTTPKISPTVENKNFRNFASRGNTLTTKNSYLENINKENEFTNNRKEKLNFAMTQKENMKPHVTEKIYTFQNKHSDTNRNAKQNQLSTINPNKNAVQIFSTREKSIFSTTPRDNFIPDTTSGSQIRNPNKNKVTTKSFKTYQKPNNHVTYPNTLTKNLNEYNHKSVNGNTEIIKYDKKQINNDLQTESKMGSIISVTKITDTSETRETKGHSVFTTNAPTIPQNNQPKTNIDLNPAKQKINPEDGQDKTLYQDEEDSFESEQLDMEIESSENIPVFIKINPERDSKSFIATTTPENRDVSESTSEYTWEYYDSTSEETDHIGFTTESNNLKPTTKSSTKYEIQQTPQISRPELVSKSINPASTSDQNTISIQNFKKSRDDEIKTNLVTKLVNDESKSPKTPTIFQKNLNKTSLTKLSNSDENSEESSTYTYEYYSLETPSTEESSHSQENEIDESMEAESSELIPSISETFHRLTDQIKNPLTNDTNESSGPIFCTCHKFVNGELIPINNGEPFTPNFTLPEQNEAIEELNIYYNTIIDKLKQENSESFDTEDLDEITAKRIDNLISEQINKHLQKYMCPNCGGPNLDQKPQQYTFEFVKPPPNNASQLERESSLDLNSRSNSEPLNFSLMDDFSDEYTYEYVSEESQADFTKENIDVDAKLPLQNYSEKFFDEKPLKNDNSISSFINTNQIIRRSSSEIVSNAETQIKSKEIDRNEEYSWEYYDSTSEETRVPDSSQKEFTPTTSITISETTPVLTENETAIIKKLTLKKSDNELFDSQADENVHNPILSAINYGISHHKLIDPEDTTDLQTIKYEDLIQPSTEDNPITHNAIHSEISSHNPILQALNYNFQHMLDHNEVVYKQPKKYFDEEEEDEEEKDDLEGGNRLQNSVETDLDTESTEIIEVLGKYAVRVPKNISNQIKIIPISNISEKIDFDTEKTENIKSKLFKIEFTSTIEPKVVNKDTTDQHDISENKTFSQNFESSVTDSTTKIAKPDQTRANMLESPVESGFNQNKEDTFDNTEQVMTKENDFTYEIYDTENQEAENSNTLHEDLTMESSQRIMIIDKSVQYNSLEQIKNSSENTNIFDDKNSSENTNIFDENIKTSRSFENFNINQIKNQIQSNSNENRIADKQSNDSPLEIPENLQINLAKEKSKPADESTTIEIPQHEDNHNQDSVISESSLPDTIVENNSDFIIKISEQKENLESSGTDATTEVETPQQIKTNVLGSAIKSDLNQNREDTFDSTEHVMIKENDFTYEIYDTADQEVQNSNSLQEDLTMESSQRITIVDKSVQYNSLEQTKNSSENTNIFDGNVKTSQSFKNFSKDQIKSNSNESFSTSKQSNSNPPEISENLQIALDLLAKQQNKPEDKSTTMETPQNEDFKIGFDSEVPSHEQIQIVKPSISNIVVENNSNVLTKMSEQKINDDNQNTENKERPDIQNYVNKDLEVESSERIQFVAHNIGQNNIENNISSTEFSNETVPEQTGQRNNSVVTVKTSSSKQSTDDLSQNSHNASKNNLNTMEPTEIIQNYNNREGNNPQDEYTHVKPKLNLYNIDSQKSVEEFALPNELEIDKQHNSVERSIPASANMQKPVENQKSKNIQIFESKTKTENIQIQNEDTSLVHFPNIILNNKPEVTVEPQSDNDKNEEVNKLGEQKTTKSFTEIDPAKHLDDISLERSNYGNTEPNNEDYEVEEYYYDDVNETDENLNELVDTFSKNEEAFTASKLENTTEIKISENFKPNSNEQIETVDRTLAPGTLQKDVTTIEKSQIFDPDTSIQRLEPSLPENSKTKLNESIQEPKANSVPASNPSNENMNEEKQFVNKLQTANPNAFTEKVETPTLKKVDNSMISKNFLEISKEQEKLINKPQPFDTASIGKLEITPTSEVPSSEENYLDEFEVESSEHIQVVDKSQKFSPNIMASLNSNKTYESLSKNLKTSGENAKKSLDNNDPSIDSVSLTKEAEQLLTTSNDFNDISTLKSNSKEVVNSTKEVNISKVSQQESNSTTKENRKTYFDNLFEQLYLDLESKNENTEILNSVEPSNNEKDENSDVNNSKNKEKFERESMESLPHFSSNQVNSNELQFKTFKTHPPINIFTRSSTERSYESTQEYSSQSEEDSSLLTSNDIYETQTKSNPTRHNFDSDSDQPPIVAFMPAVININSSDIPHHIRQIITDKMINACKVSANGCKRLEESIENKKSNNIISQLQQSYSEESTENSVYEQTYETSSEYYEEYTTEESVERNVKPIVITVKPVKRSSGETFNLNSLPSPYLKSYQEINKMDPIMKPEVAPNMISTSNHLETKQDTTVPLILPETPSFVTPTSDPLDNYQKTKSDKISSNNQLETEKDTTTSTSNSADNFQKEVKVNSQEENRPSTFDSELIKKLNTFENNIKNPDQSQQIDFPHNINANNRLPNKNIAPIKTCTAHTVTEIPQQIHTPIPPMDPHLVTTLRSVFGPNSGKIVPATELPEFKNVNRKLISGQMYFLANNGMKIPLKITRNKEGKLQLTLDVTKICKNHYQPHGKCDCTIDNITTEKSESSYEYESTEYEESRTRESDSEYYSSQYEEDSESGQEIPSDIQNKIIYYYKNNPLSRTIRKIIESKHLLKRTPRDLTEIENSTKDTERKFFQSFSRISQQLETPENNIMSPFSQSTTTENIVEQNQSERTDQNKMTKDYITPTQEFNYKQENTYNERSFGDFFPKVPRNHIEAQHSDEWKAHKENENIFNQYPHLKNNFEMNNFFPNPQSKNDDPLKKFYSHHHWKEDEDHMNENFMHLNNDPDPLHVTLLHKENENNIDVKKFPSVDHLTKFDQTVASKIDNFRINLPLPLYDNENEDDSALIKKLIKEYEKETLNEVHDENEEFYNLVLNHLLEQSQKQGTEMTNHHHHGHGHGHHRHHHHHHHNNHHKHHNSNEDVESLKKRLQLYEQIYGTPSKPLHPIETPIYHQNYPNWYAPPNVAQNTMLHPYDTNKNYALKFPNDDSLSDEITTKKPTTTPSSKSSSTEILDERKACDNFVNKRLGLVRSLFNWVRDWITETAVKTKQAITSAAIAV